MSKRSAEEKIERYRKKIEELSTSKPKRRRLRVIYSDSSDESADAFVQRSVVTAQIHRAEAPQSPPIRNVVEPEPVPPNLPGSPTHPVSPVEPVVSAEPLWDISPPVAPEQDEIQQEASADVVMTEPQLDPELLQALGEAADDTPDFGEKIHESLAKLWPSILKKGLPKESKDKMCKEYLVPENCTLLQAPKLNAEISAAVPDMVRNRDKTLSNVQQQLGFGITAINKALEILLKGDDKKRAIQHLSNSCRILSDLHSTYTQSRIKLLTPSLDKSFLHVIQDSERDDTLFGNKLSDKIKAAKAIERQGLQIKKAPNPRVSNSANSTNPRFNNTGNWPAPPRYQSSRGGRGGWKKPPPSRRPYSSSTQQGTKPPAANKPRPSTTQQ